MISEAKFRYLFDFKFWITIDFNLCVPLIKQNILIIFIIIERIYRQIQLRQKDATSTLPITLAKNMIIITVNVYP
jgi:uncharacterized membrane protein YhdT